MKLVTSLADFEGEKCMYFLRYNTKLLAFARNARFSNISTTAHNNQTHKGLICKFSAKYIWIICMDSHSNPVGTFSKVMFMRRKKLLFWLQIEF